jgi:diaminopimelate epimerase
MKKQPGYTIIDTAGQKTAVIAPSFPRGQQPLISKLLMTINPVIEQVAFLEKFTNSPTRYRLQMMGNELSINGSLAGAYLLTKIKSTKKVNFTISGLNRQVTSTIKDDSVSIDFPASIVKNVKGNVVYLKGITYQIQRGFPKTSLTTPKQKSLLSKLATTSPAAGIIFCQKTQIKPLVYVKATNSFVWENACGSGSLAYYLITGQNKVKQSSKTVITINKNRDKLAISAPVKEITK